MFAIAMLWPETRDAVYKFATFGEFGSESMYEVLKVKSETRDKLEINFFVPDPAEKINNAAFF